MTKKGQFFITILVLIALIIFSISVLMYRTSQSFEDRVGELNAFERLNNLDLSTQNVLRHSFDDYSGMNLSVSSSSNGPQVRFDDTLPSIHSSLNTSLDSLKNYLESNFDYINLSVEPVKTNLPLFIKSYNILYNHTGIRQINITSPDDNIKSIDIYIYDIGSVITQESKGIASPGDIIFSYAVVDSSSPAIISSASTTIADDAETSINVTTNNGVIMIKKKSSNDLNNPRGIEIIIPSSAKVQTTLALINNGNKLEVGYPQGIINISFPSYGISKLGEARLR